MTEQEWLGCGEPQKMLDFLPEATDRKLRMFAVACCRRLSQLFADETSHRAIEMSERYADGFATEEDLAAISAVVTEFENVILYLLVPEMWLSSAVSNATHNAAERHGILTPALDFESAHKSEYVVQSRFLRDIVGNPFRPVTVAPAWRTATAVSLATAIYDERAFGRLPILADALEDAGCTDADILSHCRQPGAHVRGCWVVDLVLGKS